MFSKTQISKVNINSAVDVSGRRLVFAGNLPCQAGDFVWTDGRVIFGNMQTQATPFFFDDSTGGVPVLTNTLRGYFDKNGNFKSYSIADDSWIVNNDKLYFHGEPRSYLRILDAEISTDGKLLIAEEDFDDIGPYERWAYSKITISKDNNIIQDIRIKDLIADELTDAIEVWNTPILDFKLRPDSSWAMLFNIEIIGLSPVIDKNGSGSYPSILQTKNLLPFIKTNSNSVDKQIRIYDSQEGRNAVLTEIQAQFKNVTGHERSKEDLMTSPYLTMIANVYSPLFAPYSVHIVARSTSIDSIDPPLPFVSKTDTSSDDPDDHKRKWKKFLVCKVDGSPDFVFKYVKRDKFKGYTCSQIVTSNQMPQVSSDSDERIIQPITVGTYYKIEYLGLLGNVIAEEILEDTEQVIYAYCDIFLSDNNGDDDADDKEKLLFQKDFFFPVQDDFSVKHKLSTTIIDAEDVETEEWFTYTDVFIDVTLEALYKNNSKVCDLNFIRKYDRNYYIHFAEEGDWDYFYYGDAPPYSLSATKLNAGSYLVGDLFGSLFLCQNNSLKNLGTRGLRNFRLRYLKNISKAKK